MYAKICDMEMLSTYVTDVVVGDVLVVQALVANPLDWHHFYEKLLAIKKGNRTDFTIVTKEGERLVGSGEVKDLERWNTMVSLDSKSRLPLKNKSHYLIAA